MHCRKCGAELHEDQKVCIVCGTRTAAGGEFYVEEEKRWQPSRNMLIGAAAFILILIVLIIINSMRVTPPGDVAMEWFSAMSQRQFNTARSHMTPGLIQKLKETGVDMMAIADDFYTVVNTDEGKAFLGTVIQEPPSDPKTATVTINLRYPAGKSGKQVMVKLVKSGRAWKVNELILVSV